MENTPVFETFWRNKWMTSHCKNLDEMITVYEETIAYFKELKANGVILDPSCVSSMSDDYASFMTFDPIVAEKFGFTKKEDSEDEDY